MKIHTVTAVRSDENYLPIHVLGAEILKDKYTNKKSTEF